MMLRFVLVANPQTRRVELFQEALARFGLPPAELVPYEDLLAGQCILHQWNTHDRIFRFDAPERNFAVDRAFIAAGADVNDPGQHQRLSAKEAYNLPEDKGRLLCSRQWYLGWQHRLQEWVSPIQGYVMNHPDDIVKMFDKIQCQQILAAAGIPIPRSLTGSAPIQTYEDLKDRMDQLGHERVFVKLAHGSSASGVVAYERRGDYERAITTVERAIEEGELRFYNSRKVRQYRNPSDIADIMNFLTKERVQVEAWVPKARLNGREFDIRVVVINGQARQAVLRVGNSPMTNLHLGSDRYSIADLPSGITPQAWAIMMQTCEQATACFPKSFYCGIDLLIAPNLRDHSILELNAFGDLLQGMTWNGQDTYTTEIEMLGICRGIPNLRQGDPPVAPTTVIRP
jgi:glutathione synthase/RimK-type ligase-like ATP-grasp enzyme